MECKHFGSCGSCGLYAQPYEAQLQYKKEKVANLLLPFYPDEMTIFDSPHSHYRARAEFRIWHNGDRCDYAMGNLDKNGAVIIQMCPKVITPIEKRMWRLLEVINASPKILGTKLFGVEFLATTTDACLITLLYHRTLDNRWQEEAKHLQETLDAHIIGRSRKQKVVLTQEYVTETLTIAGENFHYRHYESCFTQPNPEVNRKMIQWAITQAKKVENSDFLESYCGLGNFTLPLSHLFQKVLATEISKRSIEAAVQNCTLNTINNISFVRLSSEEMSEALEGKRAFNRLREVDLNSYYFGCVLVDPPRAGLDSATINLIATIPYIIYISCNPETLAHDLETLCLTHSIQTTALFDQFPHTEHVECGVFLSQKER